MNSLWFAAHLFTSSDNKTSAHYGQLCSPKYQSLTRDLLRMENNWSQSWS